MAGEALTASAIETIARIGGLVQVGQVASGRPYREHLTTSQTPPTNTGLAFWRLRGPPSLRRGALASRTQRNRITHGCPLTATTPSWRVTVVRGLVMGLSRRTSSTSTRPVIVSPGADRGPEIPGYVQEYRAWAGLILGHDRIEDRGRHAALNDAGAEYRGSRQILVVMERVSVSAQVREADDVLLGD